MRASLFLINNLLPYFISSMNDESSLVQIEAAESTMELLDSIESPIVLLPTDFKVFQLYIFPTYQKMNLSSDLYIRSSLMKLIGKICVNGRKFIEQGIINQTIYFKSLREKEKFEESKETKQEGVDFYIGVNTSISNLDTEMDAMESMITSIILDSMSKVSNVYQSAFIPHIHNIVESFGPKIASLLSSSLFCMLNTKSFPLRLGIFKHAPEMNLGLGMNWVNGLSVYFESYIFKSEELLIYYVIECLVHLAKNKLLEKKEMIELYQKVASFLVHPNIWIRTAAIRFCKAVGSSQSDADFFLDMRMFLHYFVKDFIMVTSSDPFHEFLRTPLSRLAIDIIEANIPVKLNYISTDEYSRTMFEIRYKLEDLYSSRNSKEQKEEYDKFVNRLRNKARHFPLYCIGKVPAQPRLRRLSKEGMDQTDNLSQHIFKIAKDFEIPENEVDEYIDKYFIPQTFSDPNNFFSDNNGMNPSSGYVNFQIIRDISISWQKYFKNASLCKALHYYTQEYKGLQVQSIKPLRLQWKPKGRLMATLNTHEAPVYSIGVSDSMLLMVTGDADGMCCIWDTGKLKDYFAVPLGGKIVVEGKVTALKFLQNSHTITVGTNKGTISLFKIDNDIQKEKYIPIANEGGIVNCCTYHDSYSTIVYITQRGIIHVHDTRVKRNVNSFDVGSQKGLVNAFCMGPDQYSYFIGTAGGYIFGYDIRFNLVTTACRHSSQLPIMDMCTYVPEKNLKLKTNEPLLFIATNGHTQQVDLCYINKETPEWSFVIGNNKWLYQSYVPYGLCKEESIYTNVNRSLQKRITESILDSSRCQAAFKDFNAHVMKMYEENSSIYKILCPRISHTEESASFLLTAGADRIVRYWHLGNLMGSSEMKTNDQEMVKNSFIIISPDNKEVEYDVANFRERVLFEKPAGGTKHNDKSGQSIWQEMNGITRIKDKETRAPYVNHTDAILNMDLIESRNARFLATCGRDNLVKLWS